MKLAFPKVLVIDDDESFRAALARWLSQLGYVPTVAPSAVEGVACLGEGGYAAILLDLQLPDMSGHAILRQLGRYGVAVPIIIVSGTTDMDDVLRAWRGNAADFLRKPFSIDDLAVALDKVVKATPVVVATTEPTRGTPASGERVPATAAREPEAKARPGLRPAVAELAANLRAGSVRLPILDPRVVRLPTFLTTEDWTVEELADTIARDSNLAAGILRAANSATYSRGKEVTSLRDACTRLGSKAVVAIAFEITVKGQFAAPAEPGRSALKNSWRNAVVASRVAPLLAEKVCFPRSDELRLATLFHNVGELVAICLLADLDRPGSGVSTAAQLATEVDALHEDLGGALAASWKLPPFIARAATFHHRPAPSESAEDALSRGIVLASWAIALRAGFTYFPGHDVVDPMTTARPLGLSEQDLLQVFEKIRTWAVDP